MSAKHKRPFYVFAAVAAVCCLVLVTGIRGSKADDGRSPVIAGEAVAGSGAPISPIPGSDGDASAGSTPGAISGPDGGSDPSTPELDDPGASGGGGDAEEGPDSGASVLPPTGLPFPPVVDPGGTPPVNDDQPGGRDHGTKGDKKDKDKDKDKDEHGDSSDESEADAESEDEIEVDPDVYEVDGDESGGDEVDEPTDGVTP